MEKEKKSGQVMILMSFYISGTVVKGILSFGIL